jgi:fibronectin-binding autotransporter adhesin
MNYTNTDFKLFCSLIVITLIGTHIPSFAQSSTWNVASGTWSTASNWVSGTVAGGVDNTATFNNTNTSSDRTVTLTAPVTIGNIFANGSIAQWFITGGTLTLDTTSGLPVINVNPGGAGDRLRIDSLLAGNDGFEVTGGGRLFINNLSNSFTGGVRINTSTLWTRNAESLNGNTVTTAGSIGVWLLDNAAGGTGNYTSNLVLGPTGAGNNRLDFSSAGNYTLSGIISETGAGREILYRTGGSDIHATISGNNSYTGQTQIGATFSAGRTVVRATNSNAFGTGTTNVSLINTSDDDDALELAGGITISNKTLQLNGRGAGLNGSLRNISGTNVWAGNVTTGTRSDPRIGVDADRLTITGIISGSASGGITKVGSGILELTGANTFSLGMNVSAGTLLVNNTAGSATGSGTVAVASGATLGGSGIISGVTTINGTLQPGNSPGTLTINNTLSLASTAVLDWEINVTDQTVGSGINDLVTGVTNLTLDGTINFSLIGGPSITSAGVWRLFNYTGTLTNNVLDIGTLPLDVGLTASIDVDTFGQVNLVVIPEPATVSLLLTAVAFGVMTLRRRMPRGADLA